MQEDILISDRLATLKASTFENRTWLTNKPKFANELALLTQRKNKKLFPYFAKIKSANALADREQQTDKESLLEHAVL